MIPASTGHPVLPRIIGVILLLSGLALVFGGIKLLMLGGSWYYLPTGIAVGIAGMAKRIGSGIIWPVFNYEYHLGLVGNGAGLVATGSPAGTLVWPWPFADSTVVSQAVVNAQYLTCTHWHPKHRVTAGRWFGAD